MWSDAAKWDPSRAPQASDRVCIPRGRVTVRGHAWHVASVNGDALVLDHGSLEVWDANRASVVDRLNLVRGTLDGAARIQVRKSLLWGPFGSMQGGGSTILLRGALGVMRFGARGYGQLARNFGNYGRLTLASGTLYGSFGVTLGNAGTLILRGGSKDAARPVGLLTNRPPTPCLANTGVLRAYASGTLTLGFAPANSGRVIAASGTLDVVAGGGSCAVPS